MYGTDYEYADSRLSGSIVRVAKTGEPIYIESVDVVSGTAAGKLLRTSEAMSIHVGELNLKPVPLGWCNQARGATYLSRIPKRQDWKQGIRAQSCFSSVTQFGRITHKDLAECILGVYPTLGKLLGERWPRLTAWSRKWASDGILLYHGIVGEVGTMSVDKGPALREKFSFLRESLEKSCS